MTELRIPAVGDSVSEVDLLEWVVANGASVKEGDHIYTVASDKSNMEIESPVDGVLEIIEQPGECLEIGRLVGKVV